MIFAALSETSAKASLVHSFVAACLKGATSRLHVFMDVQSGLVKGHSRIVQCLVLSHSVSCELWVVTCNSGSFLTPCRTVSPRVHSWS